MRRCISPGGMGTGLVWLAVVSAVGAGVVVATAFGAPLVAGRTNAPDAVSATFRAGADAHTAAVDIAWDAPASADSGGSGSAALITLDGVKVECLTPATGSAGKSGGTAAGGNGTTRWTMSCGPITEGKHANQRPSKANIARVVIIGDSATDATHEFFNPLEQIDVAAGGRTTNLPDLVSAKFSTGTTGPSGNKVDLAVYTFSKPVTLLKNPSAFGVTPVEGGGGSTIATSNGPFPGDEPVVAGHTVKIYWTLGTLKLGTQAYVDQEAVEGHGGVLSLDGQVGATIAGATGPPPPPTGPSLPPVGPSPTPPTLPPNHPNTPVTINNGAGGTHTRTVYLTFPRFVPKGTTKVLVSNSAKMSGARTFSYKKGVRVKWSLAVFHNGTRETVFVRFVNAKGKRSRIYNHSILEDTRRPTRGKLMAPQYIAGTTAIGNPPPLYVGWNAGTDKGTGVASYVVRARKGRRWKVVARTRGLFAFLKVSSAKTYRFSVTAVDGAGNSSKAVKTSSRRVSVISSGSKAISYSGSWSSKAGVRTGASGASLKFSFTGRSLACIAPTSISYGGAQVTVDGKSIGAVTLYQGKDGRRVVYVWSGSSRKHTIQIKAASSQPIAVSSFISLN